MDQNYDSFSKEKLDSRIIDISNITTDKERAINYHKENVPFDVLLTLSRVLINKDRAIVEVSIHYGKLSGSRILCLLKKNKNVNKWEVFKTKVLSIS